MPIKLSQATQRNNFPCPHWVHTKTGDGKELITMTGIAVFDMKMPSPIPSGWHGDRLELELRFPITYPPGYNQFQVDQWSLCITPNAFYQRQRGAQPAPTNDEVGIAVNKFWGPGHIKFSSLFKIYADLAIRGHYTRLYRVSYQITLCGRFVRGSSRPTPKKRPGKPLDC